MGCPIHIWLPMMAALAPGARMVRDRLSLTRFRKAEPENPAHHIEDMRRWSAISEPASPRTSD